MLLAGHNDAEDLLRIYRKQDVLVICSVFLIDDIV